MFGATVAVAVEDPDIVQLDCPNTPGKLFTDEAL